MRKNSCASRRGNAETRLAVVLRVSGSNPDVEAAGYLDCFALLPMTEKAVVCERSQL